MLDFMRRQQSKLKWVWIVIIAVFVLSLVAFFPYGGLDTVTIMNLSGSVAKVGGEEVSAREFQSAYRAYMQQVQAQLPPDVRRAFGFEKQVLEALIGQHVITAQAEKLGLQVSPEEIEQRILATPAFIEGGSFIGLARYQALLAQYNLTVEDFENSIRMELLHKKLLSFVTAGVSVTDKEVEDEYRRRNEKVKLDYFIIDPGKLENQVAPTEQEQRDYYEKNKSKYNEPERRKAKFVFVDNNKWRLQATATDQELRDYFDQHQEEYRLPERVTAQHILFKTQGKKPEEIDAIQKKAREVLERAKKGEDFGKLAKQFSDDSSASRGGDLGSFGRGQMVPPFEQAAFSLGVGAISDLVKSDFGFHIIKVNEKQEGRLRPFEEMKEAVRPVVLYRKGEQKAGEVSQQIAVDLVSQKDFNAVAMKHGAEVRETPFLEQSSQVPDLGNSTDFVKRVFTLAKD